MSLRLSAWRAAAIQAAPVFLTGRLRRDCDEL